MHYGLKIKGRMCKNHTILFIFIIIYNVIENGNHNKSHETRSVYLQYHILQAAAHYRIHLPLIVPKK